MDYHFFITTILLYLIENYNRQFQQTYALLLYTLYSNGLFLLKNHCKLVFPFSGDFKFLCKLWPAGVRPNPSHCKVNAYVYDALSLQLESVLTIKELLCRKRQHRETERLFRR